MLFIAGLSVGIFGKFGGAQVEDLVRMVAKTLQPRIAVTVAGHIRKPGSHSLDAGASLGDALTEAGGPTAFAATNRVELHRGGRVLVYNMRKASHREVPLEIGDAIRVPQKNWLAR